MARLKASASGRTELGGMDDLRKALEELGSEVATKLGKQAVRDSAVYLQGKMVAAAPHRPGVQLKYYGRKRGRIARNYGDLRDNIKVRLAKSRKVTAVSYTVSTGQAFWGYFLEFGTVRMAAQPWMRPTFDAAVNVCVDLQIDRLRAGIARVAKKNANKAPLANGRSA